MKKVQRKKMDAENAAARKSSARGPAANNCSEDDGHDVPLIKVSAADDSDNRAASQVPSEKEPAIRSSLDADAAKERATADVELKNGQSDEQSSDEAAKGRRKNGKTAKSSPVSPKKRKASNAKSETENEDASSSAKKSKKSNKKESKPVEEEYEVQSIVGHKKEGGVSYYLVRWKGYTADDDTWEPEQDLSCPELVEKFKRNASSPANGKGGGKKAATAAASPKVATSKKATPKTKPKQADPEKEWEVEKIIDYSVEKGERLFRIRWKGFAAKDDTWEPESNLNCAEIIKKFMDRMDSQENVSVKELREEPKKVRRLVNEMPRHYQSSNSERKSKRSVAKQRIYYGDSD